MSPLMCVQLYFSQCPTNGELNCSQAKDDDDDDDDDGNSDDDSDDDDDNGNEMMIRALRVSWVNCGKVGGL